MVNTYKFQELWEINRNLKAIDMFAEIMLLGHTTEWVAINYDTTEDTVKANIKKFSNISLQPIMNNYTYVDGDNFYAYCAEVGFAPEDIEVLKFAFGLEHEEKLDTEITRCHQLVGKLFVTMKLTGAMYTDRSKLAKVSAGDRDVPFYNKYITTFFGLYPSLMIKDRELFNSMALEGGKNARLIIDAWFNRMSRAGLASKHNMAIGEVTKTVNMVARRIFGTHIPIPSFPPITVDMDYLFNMLVNNDISEHPSLIVACLQSEKLVEDFIADYPHIEQNKFLEELSSTLVEVYRLMRNGNRHLVVDSKTGNITSYSKLGEPFQSIYMTKSAASGLL